MANRNTSDYYLLLLEDGSAPFSAILTEEAAAALNAARSDSSRWISAEEMIARNRAADE